MTQPPLLAVVRWCKEGNNALSQLIHTFGVVRSREIVLEFERTTPSAPFKGTGIFLDGASTPPLPRRGVGAQRFLATLSPLRRPIHKLISDEMERLYYATL